MADFFASAFWTGFLWPLIVMIAQSVLLLVVLLIAIAYILLADRKIWAAVQIRRGPNVVGPWGLLQSFADLLKFVLKEPIIPSGANKGVFLLAPLVSCVLALAAWAVIPMDLGWVISDINVGVLYIFAISSLSIYGIIMAGWSSNSKYPFLAALRSAAQMVSYEVSIGFVIITVLLCAGSLNLSAVVEAQNTRGLGGLIGLPQLTFLNWYVWPLFPMFAIFYVSALAETNALSVVHAGRICRDHHDVRDGHDPVPGRLAAAGRGAAVHLGPRGDLVRAQGIFHVLHVCDGEGNRAALPLRPANAARLEGIPAVVAGDGGCRRRRAALRGDRAEMRSL
jgi:hypothetical protein